MTSRISMRTLEGNLPHFNAIFAPLIVALAVALFLLYESNLLERNTIDDSIREGRLLFATSSTQISNALYFNNIEQIREDAENIVGRGNVQTMAVFTEAGRFLTDSRQRGIPSGFIEAEQLELVFTRDDVLYRISPEHISFVGAIRIESEVLGGIYFEIDLTEQLALNQEILQESAITGLFLMILAAATSFGLTYLRGTTQSLRLAESNFRNLIEGSPLPCSIHTQDGALVQANAAMQQLMGSREKTRRMTRPDYNIYTDKTLAQLGITQLIHSAYEDIEVDIPVFEYRKDSDPESDTDRLWLKITVFPPRAADGAGGEMVVIYQDRTSEKLAEQERAELNAFILQGQKLEGLGSMARGIAHDFNNLLTPVLGNADMLQQVLELNDDQHRMMESIKSAAKRASDLCDQMLTYGGEGTKDWQPTDLSAEISSLSELIRSSVSQKVLLQRYFDQKLPKVLADRTQLRSIILNLLINASEALGENPGEIQLTTGTRTLTESESGRLLPDPNLPAGDYVYIEVSDNGDGMTEEVQARLFDPFFTTKFNGRGLGLSAVLGIVGDHQGGITFTSSPGHGTTFVIYFPAIAA